MDRIKEIEQIAVVVPRSVGCDDFRRIDDSPCGEFAEGDIWFPKIRVFGANPCGADNVLKGVIDSEMLLAEHEGEVELFCGGGLFGAIMAMDVVVERLEWAFADATAVQLDADAFSVLCRPLGGLFDVFEIAVMFAREIEFVENVRHGFEANRAVCTQIDGCADFDRWKIPFQNRRDERRRGRDNVWKQTYIVHFHEDVFDQICQFMADGLLAVAIAIEKCVELEAILAGP